MKQVIRKGIKEIIVDDVPDPIVIPHHVLIRPSNSVISSGTEVASIHQDGLLKEVADNPSHLKKVWAGFKTAGPIRTVSEVRAKLKEYAVLGYSGAGVVVDKHPSVSEFDIGDRVAYGGEGTGHAETIVAGSKLVAKVPDRVPFDQASFTTLGSIALNAIRTAGTGVGDKVAIVGLGVIGQIVAQLVRLQGSIAIAIDLRKDRIDMATQLGADYGLLSGDDLESQIKLITDGNGVDCVIVAAASKSAAVCHQALRICRDRGRLVIVGAVELSFPWEEMYLKEIQLFMSRAYGPGSYDPKYERQGHDYPLPYVRWTENRNMEEFLRLLDARRINIAPLITHRFPLTEASRAYDTILNPEDNSLAVVLDYPRPEVSENGAGTFKPTRKVVVSKAAAPKTSELRVAVTGAGNIARWAHLPALTSLPNVKLEAIVSASGARGKSYARRFGASYCSSDYDQVLADDNIDAVMVLSRNQHHFSQALAALQAGKHVFVEKPMALSEGECVLLCQAVAESGKQLAVGFNRRFAPFYVDQKKAFSKRNGPAVIQCRVHSPGISGSYWMADPSIGGAIMGEAVHFIDLMYWLLESEPVVVSAFSLPTESKAYIGENNVVASFRFADGSIGNLTYTTVGSQKSAGELVEVFSSSTTAVTQDFKKLRLQSQGSKSTNKWWPEKGYKAQLETFFTAIRNGAAPIATVRDGSRATLACLRMLESAKTGQPCAIDLQSLLDECAEPNV